MWIDVGRPQILIMRIVCNRAQIAPATDGYSVSAVPAFDQVVPQSRVNAPRQDGASARRPTALGLLGASAGRRTTGIAIAVPGPGRCCLQAVLRRIDRDGGGTSIGHGVRVVLDTERLVVQRDLALAHTEEATDADHNGGDLAVPVEDQLVDLANGLVGVVLDVDADQLAGSRAFPARPEAEGLPKQCRQSALA